MKKILTIVIISLLASCSKDTKSNNDEDVLSLVENIHLRIITETMANSIQEVYINGELKRNDDVDEALTLNLIAKTSDTVIVNISTVNQFGSIAIPNEQISTSLWTSLDGFDYELEHEFFPFVNNVPFETHTYENDIDYYVTDTIPFKN